MASSQRTPPLLKSASARTGLFDIRTDYDGHRWLVSLRGELDLSNVTALEQELREAEASEATRIVVDLSLLEFLDSSGLHTLVQAARRSRKHGDRLRLIPGSEHVQSVFRLTKTEQHLPFIGDEAET